MSFDVKLVPKVAKFLKKADKNLRKRIGMKLRLLENGDPFNYLEHFEGGNLYKLRVGDFRLLVQVDFSRKVLIVRYIGDRKNIYKNI